MANSREQYLKKRRLSGHFYGKYIEIIGLKAPGNDSASIRINEIRFQYRITQNSSFHDFCNFGRAMPFQNQLFLSLETPGYVRKVLKIRGTFQTYFLYKSPILGPDISSLFEQTRAGKYEKTLNNILNIWDMGSISCKEHAIDIL